MQLTSASCCCSVTNLRRKQLKQMSTFLFSSTCCSVPFNEDTFDKFWGAVSHRCYAGVNAADGAVARLL